MTTIAEVAKSSISYMIGEPYSHDVQKVAPMHSPHLSPLKECLAHATKIADYCATNAASIDIHGAFPVQEFEQIAEAGLLAVPLGQEFGGLGLGIDASLTHGYWFRQVRYKKVNLKAVKRHIE